MNTSKAHKERIGFSSRLQQALLKAGYAPDSPTFLAREFNLRFSGKAVTLHACRKWLIGESMPTQEKLRILADWLNVSREWLRYGGDGNKDGETDEIKPSKISQKEFAIMEDLKRLTSDQQNLIHMVVLHMAKAETTK